MNELILDIKNISKSFPRVIANNKVTFGIKKNSVHAILGENGAGKSTFVKILYGLLEPDEGSIDYNNKPFEINSPAELEKMGLVWFFNIFLYLNHFQLEKI